MSWSLLGVEALVALVGSLLLFGTGLAIVLRERRLVLVDTLWGLSFVVIAACGFLSALVRALLPGSEATVGAGVGPRRFIILATVSIWGLRLALHLHRRNGHGEDERYAALLARTPGSFQQVALKRVFLPQAVISFIIASPILVGMATLARVDWVFWLGVGVWAVGFFFEAVGDAQLTAFRADPANKGRVLDTGLWGLTRHPNYFGDATVWTGLWLMATGTPPGWLTFISPLAMTYFLYARTGKALLEKHMAARRGPEYQAYRERVSGFFPLPPKKRQG